MSENEINAIVLGGLSAACLAVGLVWAAALRSGATGWVDAVSRHPVQALNVGLLVWVLGVQGLAVAAGMVVPGVPVRAFAAATPVLGLTIWAVARRGHRERGGTE